MKEIADRLTKFREAKGYSQEKVTINTKINIGKIELGETNVALTTMSILCKYYDVSMEDLFRGL
ncbi:MAG: helix-turn-helix domain-containing protein [Alistipes sp.]|nr:helix-turn-helix domain-containing protein [Alistipes sp.]